MNHAMITLLVFPTVYLLLVQGAEGLIINSTMQHSIEIRVIVDKWAFNNWYQVVDTTLTEAEKITQTQMVMTKYLKSVFFGANTIFAGLLSSGIRLDVRINDIQFITGETIAPEAIAGSKKADVDIVLKNFENWLKTKSYFKTDHSMLLTGLDIMRGNNSQVLGVANLGAICSAASLSVLESHPNGNAVLTMVHELGHSLNAAHDGEGNVCSSATFNIMDPVRQQSSPNNYRFSSCSISSIKNKLQSLYDTITGNCLSAANTMTAATVGLPLGKLYTPDQICQLSYGPTSYVCRSLYGTGAGENYTSICTSIWCSVSSGQCQSAPGADGFVCGKGKECLLGLCQTSSSAPNVSDTCPLGNPPLNAFVSNTSTCSELITAKDSSKCYSSWYRRSCCGSCEAALTGLQNCEYGDKSSWCATSTYPYVCGLNGNICCKSCKPYYNASNVGCEYGDRESWCATMDYPYGCLLNGNTCCKSCKPYYNASNIGCEYGDKASWCATLDYPYGCVLNGNTCCKSCKPYYNASNIGCEYGDKHKACATATYPNTCTSNADVCCGSCAAFRTKAVFACLDKSSVCANAIAATPSLCYNSDNLSLCCASCSKYASSNPNCKYGDRNSNCTLSHCALNASSCCKTCA